MNLPQETEKAPAFLAKLRQDVNDLIAQARANRLVSSPTVRVEQTQIGSSLHATPPAPVSQDTGDQVWL